MPTDGLINHVLSPMESTTSRERFVLKLPAARLKQLDPDYELYKYTDTRIMLNDAERGWLSGQVDGLKRYSQLFKPASP